VYSIVTLASVSYYLLGAVLSWGVADSGTGIKFFAKSLPEIVQKIQVYYFTTDKLPVSSPI
jgi:hypothetical protein